MKYLELAWSDRFHSWFPPGLEIRENLENGKTFSSQGKVREFCQDWKNKGKVREFDSNYWKNREKLYWKIEKNTGKVGEVCQTLTVKTQQIWYHTLNKKITLKKILENSRKYWKSQGNWLVQKCGNHVHWYG